MAQLTSLYLSRKFLEVFLPLGDPRSPREAHFSLSSPEPTLLFPPSLLNQQKGCWRPLPKSAGHGRSRAADNMLSTTQPLLPRTLSALERRTQRRSKLQRQHTKQTVLYSPLVSCCQHVRCRCILLGSSTLLGVCFRNSPGEEKHGTAKWVPATFWVLRLPKTIWEAGKEIACF